jgi:dipeptidyl aminopeptidase/acylaminoacyl peptidase
MFTPRLRWIAGLALVLAAPAARAAEPEMLPLPHRGAIVGCAFSPDGKLVATAGADKTIRLWDLATGRESKRLEVGDKVAHFAIAPDGSRIATAGPDKNGAVQMWDLATGKVVWKTAAGQGAITSLAFTPDGGRVAVGNDDRSLCVLDAGRGLMMLMARGHTGAVTTVAISPDGRTLASGGADNNVQLWEPATGRLLRRFQGHNKGVECVAFSPDGKLLATGGQDKVVRLWDLATGKELRQFETQDAVRCVAFSPDGKRVATAGADKVVRLLDTETGKEARRFGGLQGKLSGLAFSPDGKRVVTVGAEGPAIVWDLTRDEKPLPADLKLTAKELDALWSDLASDDSRKTYSALRHLRAAPADSVPFLRERLKPRPSGVDDKKVAALIADLDNDNFDAREKATKDLEDLGKPVEGALRKALAGGPSAEAKVRLEKLLAKFGHQTLTAEQARDVLAVRALEGAGTREARRLLDALVRESPGWWVTQEAKAALERLGKEK